MNVRRLLATLAVTALAGSLGCKDKKDPGDGGEKLPTYNVAIQGGDDQSGAINNVLGEPVQVVVHNPDGQPVSGVVVIFRKLAGADVTLSDTIKATGLDGVAQVDVVLGPTLGEREIVKAFVRRRPDSTAVTFSATGTPAPTITASSAANFKAGDTITLTGTNFNDTPAGNTVFIGPSQARIVGNPTTSQIRVVVPPCVATGAVSVVVQVGSIRTAPLTPAPTYVASTPDLQLALYEGITVSGTELGNCLRLQGNGASYLIVPQYATGSEPLTSVPFTLGSSATLAQVIAASYGQPAPSGPGAHGAGDLRWRFDQLLRRREIELRPEILAAVDNPSRVYHREALTLNSTRDFRVLSHIPDNDTDDFKWKTAPSELKFIGDHILLYYDKNSPSGGFSDAELTEFGRFFDVELYPLDRRTFGSESDIDHNGKIIVLMSPIVNGLTKKADCATLGFINGFFFAHDLTTGAESNRGEVFYSLVPDPTAQFSCAHSKSSVEGDVPGTFIHEFQHMISFNEHHILRRGGSEEALWLNEGLSHIAEEVGARYYEQRYPPPLGRSNPLAIFPDTAFDFIVGDLLDAYRYLANPGSTSAVRFDENNGGTLEERGAAWLFLRWLVDQKDSTILARLVQTRKTSIENIEDKAGESFTGLFGDFAMALWTDSVPGVPRSAIPPRLRFKSRNLRMLFAALNRSNPASFPSQFPIQTRTLPFNTAGVSDAMVPGTMEFFRLDTPAGSTGLALRFSRSNGTAFDVDLKAQVGIFRLR